MRARTLRRLGGILLKALVVLAGTAALLFVTRTWTLFPLAAWLARGYVEERFDADLELSGLRGDGWRTLEATHVELHARDGSPTRLRHLRADELRVRLSLVDLLLRRPGWLVGVSAKTLGVDLDLTRRGSREPGARGTGPDLGLVPDFNVLNLSGRVELGQGRRVTVEGGSVRSTTTAEGPEVDLEALAASLALLPDAEPYVGVVRAEVLLGKERLCVRKGQFEGRDGRIAVEDLSTPYANVSVDSFLSDTTGQVEIEVEGLLARLGAPPAPHSRLEARGALNDGGVVIQGARLSAANGELVVESGYLRADRGVPAWTLELTCDVPAIQSLEGLFGVHGWDGALAGRATVEGKGSFGAFQVEARAERLQLLDVPIGTGTLAGTLELDLLHPYSLTGAAAVRAAPAWVLGREFSELSGDVALTPEAMRIQGLTALQPGNRLRIEDLLLPRSGDPAKLLAGAQGDVLLEVMELERLWLRAPDAAPLPEHEIVLNATLEGGTAELAAARLNVAEGSLEALRGSLSLARSRAEVLVDLEARLAFPDLGPLGALAGEPGLVGALEGELSAVGRLSAPQVRVSARANDLVVRGFALENAALDGYLQGSEVRVERFSATSHRALLEAGGAFAFGDAGGTGTLELLRLSRDGNALALEAPADFAFGHRAASLAPLTLAGNVGMLELSLEREGDALEAFAHARELDLNPLLPDHGLGQAQGQIALQRIGERFSLGVQASLAGWSIPGFDGRVGAEIDLEQSDQRLDVRRFDLATTGGERFSFAGAAPVDWSQWPPLVDGPIAFRASTAGVPLARLRLPPPWDAIAREASGNFAFDLAGETAAPIGRIEVDLAELAWADETSGELKATLVLAADGVRAELDAVQPGRFSADGTAALDAPLDLGALLAREFAGLLDAPLAASFNLRAADLAWLGERLPGVRRSGGSMVADVNVEGSLRERSWSGRLVVAGGEVKFDSDLPALALVRGALHLEGGEVRLAGVTAELGGAPIQVGGTFSLPTGGPVALDLTLRGERLLLRRDPEVLLRADADLRLTGTWLTPALNGTLSLRRSFWTKRITLGDLQSGGASSSARGIPLFSFREAPFRDMTLALRVDSVEPLVLRGNIARGGLRPELMITGTGEVPRVEGRVYLEASTLSLPGGVLDFRGGTLTFDPRNPFVPSLSLVGTTEKFGHDITAVVTGPYDRPEVELTSTPPLSSEDIVLILLAGRPPTGFAEGGAIEATQNVAIFLANDFASAWLGGSDQGGESFLQRVEVISGREISRNGVPTLEIRLRVSEDYLLDESRTYLSYERDVYEDQNLGVRFAVRLR